jgi:hypothetical protein
MVGGSQRGASTRWRVRARLRVVLGKAGAAKGGKCASVPESRFTKRMNGRLTVAADGDREETVTVDVKEKLY